MGAAGPLARAGAPRPELDVVATWRQWNHVAALAMSQDGFLWVATDRGTVRFDGVTFRPSRCPTEHPTALQTAREGGLWAGFADGRVRRLVDGCAAVGDPAYDVGGAVRALAETTSGTLWAATARGVRATSPEASARVPSALASAPASAFAEDHEGRLWVASDAGLYRLDPTGFRLIAERPVVAAAVAGDGTVWAAGREGLVRVRGSDVALIDADERVRQTAVLASDADGEVWATGARRLVRLRDGALLANGRILAGRATLLDREGSLWIGTEGGELHRIAVPAARTLVITQPERAGEPTVVFAVAETRDGATWATVPEGLLRIDGTTQTRFDRRSGLLSWAPRSLAPARDGGLWIGTLDAGVWRHDDQRFVRLGGVAKPSVQSLHESADGTLYVGYGDGSVGVHRPGRAPVVHALDDGTCISATVGAECPAAPFAFADDGRGGVFIGTHAAGLFHLPSGAERVPKLVEGLPSRRILSLQAGDAGVVWVGTAGEGLVRVDNERVATVAASAGLPSSHLFGLVADRTGGLWASTVRGVFRVRLSDLDEHLAGTRKALELTTFGVDDGVSTLEGSRTFARPAIRAADGSLLFATVGGVVVFGPPEARRPLPAPAIVFDGAQADGEPRALSSAGISLERPVESLSVSFTAPTFAAAERVRFAYRLDGPETGRWVELGNRRVVALAGIDSGRYAVRVRASLDGRPWPGAEAALPIHVARLYERPGFVAAAIAAAIIAVAGFALGRVRLERARFRAVLTERNRIARDLHDSLAQVFTGISYQLERLKRALPPGDERTVRVLDQTRQMVREGRLEARHAIWDLRQEGDAGSAPVTTSLRQTLAQAELAGDAEVRLSVEGSEPPLPEVVAAAVRRVAQEATTNALAHGHARNVNVQLRFGAGTVRLMVTDDGDGFPEPGHDVPRPDSTGAGLGLVGMRERAAQAGARLEITSTPGSGARVELTWPADRGNPT